LPRQSQNRTELLRLSREQRVRTRARQQVTNRQKEGSHLE
jgi:hypothetical protein